MITGKDNRSLLVGLLLPFLLAGCGGEQTLTPHSLEGGIKLTVVWPADTEDADKASCQALVVSADGTSKTFPNLQAATNNLEDATTAGQADIYVFNTVDNISRDGGRIKVTGDGSGGITSVNGAFYSYAEKITATKDRQVMATMNRQTADLRLSLAIYPAEIIDRVTGVKARLTGVSSEMNLLTGERSTASSVSVSLAKNSYHASASLRILGMDASSTQNLEVEVILNDGNTLKTSSDISSLCSDLRSTPTSSKALSLSADLRITNGTASLSNLQRNAEDSYFTVSPLEINFPADAADASVNILCSGYWVYSVAQTGEWLSIIRNGESLQIHASENTAAAERKATVNISAGGRSENVGISQTIYLPYADREVVKLQTAVKGRGVNIVIMGDGYTSSDMLRDDGTYKHDMLEAMENFFSVYPYTDYRDYFNVYMVVAVSNEKGISRKWSNRMVDNRFGTVILEEHSTGIDCDDDLVIDYVDYIDELADVSIDDITVILPINEDAYAGTTFMYGSTEAYSQGFSIGMCPVYRTDDNFKKLVVHEAGGHCFAKLIDEYYDYSVYHPDETIPQYRQDEIAYRKTRNGWYENVDFSADIMQTSWKGFANNSKYSMVGTYEGGATYGYGVWRPEYNSCMNNNVFYYNAPSRWAQVRRIMYLAGFDYTFAQFLIDDKAPVYPASARSAASDKEFVPFAPPAVKVIPDTRKHKK